LIAITKKFFILLIILWIIITTAAEATFAVCITKKIIKESESSFIATIFG